MLLYYYNIFLHLQNRVSKDICDEVFGELSEHIYIKWINCDYNIIYFLSQLDDANKEKLLYWGNNSLLKEK